MPFPSQWQAKAGLDNYRGYEGMGQCQPHYTKDYGISATPCENSVFRDCGQWHLECSTNIWELWFWEISKTESTQRFSDTGDLLGEDASKEKGGEMGCGTGRAWRRRRRVGRCGIVVVRLDGEEAMMQNQLRSTRTYKIRCRAVWMQLYFLQGEDRIEATQCSSEIIMLVQSQLFLELCKVKMDCRDPTGSAWSRSPASVAVPIQESLLPQCEKTCGVKQRMPGA